MTGNGSYFLISENNKNGSLIQLKILQYEDWNESIGFDTPNWLKWKIKENTIKLENENFKQLLIDREIVKGNQFIRQKGNLIVY